jgi:hypothetical protein
MLHKGAQKSIGSHLGQIARWELIGVLVLLGVASGRGGTLVVLGRNNPSPYTVNGRPLYVHLNGLAIVLLK